MPDQRHGECLLQDLLDPQGLQLAGSRRDGWSDAVAVRVLLCTDGADVALWLCKQGLSYVRHKVHGHAAKLKVDSASSFNSSACLRRNRVCDTSDVLLQLRFVGRCSGPIQGKHYTCEQHRVPEWGDGSGLHVQILPCPWRRGSHVQLDVLLWGLEANRPTSHQHLELEDRTLRLHGRAYGHPDDSDAKVSAEHQLVEPVEREPNSGTRSRHEPRSWRDHQSWPCVSYHGRGDTGRHRREILNHSEANSQRKPAAINANTRYRACNRDGDVCDRMYKLAQPVDGLQVGLLIRLIR
mmetsp:Transcript_19224/g.44109  ORF Transcript_19224/g.44109 Transcript_19224/m.44109 type:complete len:295 (-) Transcript_19224:225-1109(-)